MTLLSLFKTLWMCCFVYGISIEVNDLMVLSQCKKNSSLIFTLERRSKKNKVWRIKINPIFSNLVTSLLLDLFVYQFFKTRHKVAHTNSLKIIYWPIGQQELNIFCISKGTKHWNNGSFCILAMLITTALFRLIELKKPHYTVLKHWKLEIIPEYVPLLVSL